MLKKFTVRNFKNFRSKKMILDFSSENQYDFNHEVYNSEDHCVNKAVIYGKNGSGKSNLGLALFDITTHLTDNSIIRNKYSNYTNLDLKSDIAVFEYDFVFNGIPVVYTYSKKGLEDLTKENLSVNGKEVIVYDFALNKGKVDLKGAENLNLVNSHSQISRVKYVASNAILDRNDVINQTFSSFINFVNRMLLFYSLEENNYQGFTTGSESIAEGIINSGHLKDFERFLNKMGIHYHLTQKEIDGTRQIFCRFKNGEGNFYSVASSGTKSLALFYYWYTKMENASFVFIDEFDAFYHYRLAENIVILLKSLANQQVILTTHNTDLLSNALLRPDCYYILNDNQVRPISNLTNKDLRQAHNLQKMYKAGAFDEQK